MQKMLDILHEHALEKETATLEKFYASVRDRAKGLDNAEARQKVVIELYDEFFRTAFPRMAERLGIVYTPVEVVDFIIHSVQDVLGDEFGSSLGEKDVHIIDPFTGTGTFLVRLLQSGFIPPEKLLHKYRHELHANEIVLLAYYIAAINIEETFHGLRGNAHRDKGKDDYLPFEGICLTDTFQLYESGQMELEGTFPENNKRVKRQKESPIRVVIANPPYSAGQQSENDDNRNLSYPQLDDQISSTYAERSSAPNVKNLYDSYIRAIRWASDRIQNRGVVGFVTNGYFIDGNSMDGMRASLVDEFTSIYVFNLRGNQRGVSGDVSRREGGNVFGSGSRNAVAITVLVKNPSKAGGRAKLWYRDIGDYLSREEKLKIVRKYSSIRSISDEVGWIELKPNAAHDWINQRDPAFDEFIPIGDKSGNDTRKALFHNYSLGVGTNRDAWVYNYSRKRVEANTTATITYYNEQVTSATSAAEIPPGTKADRRQEIIEPLLGRDPKRIAWSSSLIANACRAVTTKFDPSHLVTAHYRPFAKHYLYYDGLMNHRVGQMPKLWPTGAEKNICICVTATGNRGDFGVFISALIPDLNFTGTSAAAQCFPLYLYEKTDESSELQFDKSKVTEGYRRRDAITDEASKTFHDLYGKDVTKEDIFYYVYGVLHSTEYRTRFAADLKKMLPRIPLTKETRDFKAFSQAGRELAQWHLNYETVEPWNLEEHMDRFNFDPSEQFRVTKMTFARPTPEQKGAGAKWDKTKITYNSHVTLSGIPLDAYEYVVNGKPAIEWILERYQVTRDKDSGIVNDPNDWCMEHNQPRYVIDLLKRVVRVSMETIKDREAPARAH